MRTPKPVTIDFETYGVEPRPDYPPEPVGVAIKEPGKKSRYYAWGHTTENNCTKDDAARALSKVWAHKDGLLFHNAKFDLEVATTFFNLLMPPWERIHDTLFLLFLDDPHQKQLSLKPSAERLLDWPAEEQDAVCDWLVEHQPVLGVKISRSKRSEHSFGRYIAYAPGKLVGKYAVGDVDRTEALFKLLWKKTMDRGMEQPYNRERRLLPILMDMEKQGVPVDLERLRRDVKRYDKARLALDAWIIKTIKADQYINLDSGVQLVKAMVEAGKVDPEKLGQTKTGKYKSDKASLAAAITDKKLAASLRYRAQLNTCMNTFMKPWLEVAERSKGFIYTRWNQVRSMEGGSATGARTGRLSSSPNFQNIPNVFEALFKRDARTKSEARSLPSLPVDLPPLPEVRSYIVPWSEKHVLINRDYSQQELRILGHFEDDVLAGEYLAQPWLDVHSLAQTLINKMLGRKLARKPIKNTGFGLIYGMGVGKLAVSNGTTVDEAKELKDAYLAIFPGLKSMYRDMKIRAKAGKPIRTWGGREYYCEPPKVINGRIRHFDYKLINVLIQGSAADATKEAVIRYYERKSSRVKLLLTVHDELLCSAPRRSIKKDMNDLRETMESLEFDVPLLSEGYWSDTTWAELKDYDAKGELQYASQG